MFSTYSNEDYDRRNEDVDPMAASAEYELEKRVERLELFPVELEKGERPGRPCGAPLWCQLLPRALVMTPQPHGLQSSPKLPLLVWCQVPQGTVGCILGCV